MIHKWYLGKPQNDKDMINKMIHWIYNPWLPKNIIIPLCVSALSLVFSSLFPMHRAGFRQKGGSPALFPTGLPPTTPRNNILKFKQFTKTNNITMSFRLLPTCLANVVFQVSPRFVLEPCIWHCHCCWVTTLGSYGDNCNTNWIQNIMAHPRIYPSDLVRQISE